MRRAAGALLLLALAAGCLEALSREDVARLNDARAADLRIYEDDAGTPLARAYARAAYCLVDRTLASAAGEPRDGGSISCEAPR